MKRDELIKKLMLVIKESSGYSPEKRAEIILSFVEDSLTLEDTTKEVIEEDLEHSEE